jgi:ATP-dependent helicase/nuclease subunit B
VSDREVADRYAWLPALLDNDVVVLTASRRLARALKAAHAGQQVDAGRATWQTPDIHYWTDWLGRQLAEATDPVPQRLDTLSCQLTWERALRGRLPEGMLGIGGIVRQSMDAWRRAGDWEIGADTLRATARTDDERLFAAAAADVADRLKQGGWTDAAGLAAAVAALFESSPGNAPAHVAFAGFDRVSPATRRVQAALEGAGCRVTHVGSVDRHGELVAVACEDDESELRAAGAWARRILADDPGASIGIVCSGLESRAATAGRLVREGFVPGWQFEPGGLSAAVDVSYGRPLSDYPAIGIALLLLRWTSEALSGRQVSVLLRSPCWAGSDSAARARIELKLREIPDREWPVARFLAWLDTDDDAPARLKEALSAIVAVRKDDQRRSPADCIRSIDALLTETGWPGDEALTSDAFQLVNRWRELLNEVARAEIVQPEMAPAEAVRRLSSLAAETVWQPEGAAGVIQVLGVLEAAGLEFDHVWMTGMDSAQWPPAPRPSPFLSIALQRDRDMPDATPANTLAFARQVLARISGSSRHCVYSWARVRDDAEMAPSTLLGNCRMVSSDEYADPGWYAAQLAGDGTAESVAGDNAPPVAPGERVRGGAYTIQRQFNEPLAALVSGRLGVSSISRFTNGLSPGARGSLLHGALYNLFSDKPTQDALAAWSGPERERRIGSAVDTALTEFQHHADRILMRVLGLERERLRQILASCLDWEAGRDNGFSICSVEEDLSYEAHGINIGLRVDRIDRLDDGQLVVIDYKTGTPKSFVRQEGDLRDVQPVLYAAAIMASGGGDIGALLFQNIDSRKISYSGAGGAHRSKEAEQWPARLAGWLDDVDEVIRDLARGDARINVCHSSTDGRALAILSRLEEQRRVR